MPALTLPSLSSAAPPSASATAARDNTAGAAADATLDAASTSGGPQASFGQQLKNARSQQTSGSRGSERAHSTRVGQAASSAAADRTTSAARLGAWNPTAQRGGTASSTAAVTLQSPGIDGLEASRMRRASGRLADIGDPLDKLGHAVRADKASASDLAAGSARPAAQDVTPADPVMNKEGAAALVLAGADPLSTGTPDDATAIAVASAPAALHPTPVPTQAKPGALIPGESEAVAGLNAALVLAPVAQNMQNLQNVQEEIRLPIDSMPTTTSESAPAVGAAVLPLNTLDRATAEPATARQAPLNSTRVDESLSAVTAELAPSDLPAAVDPRGPATPVPAADRAPEPAQTRSELTDDPGLSTLAGIQDADLEGDSSNTTEPDVEATGNDAGERSWPTQQPAINLEPNAALLALMTPAVIAPAAPLPLPPGDSPLQGTRALAQQQPALSAASTLAPPMAPLAAASNAEPSTQQGTPDDARKPATAANLDNPSGVGMTAVSDSAASEVLPASASATHTAVAPAGETAQAPALTAPMPTIQTESVTRSAEQILVGSAAAPLEATIDPALDSAAFAPALGARIAVLARDGIEQARLNVHPADMGPITVQLALDGNQVRIDFSADMAGTRQTLEQAMPSLAASLRDAGFTLSGGGVSQQASQGQQQPGGHTNGSSASPAAAPGDELASPAGTRAAARRETGLVDLFA